MYELLDEIIDAIRSIEEAQERLIHFQELKADIHEIELSLEEKKLELQSAIAKREQKEEAELEREYYRSVI